MQHTWSTELRIFSIMGISQMYKSGQNIWQLQWHAEIRKWTKMHRIYIIFSQSTKPVPRPRNKWIYEFKRTLSEKAAFIRSWVQRNITSLLISLKRETRQENGKFPSSLTCDGWMDQDGVCSGETLKVRPTDTINGHRRVVGWVLRGGGGMILFYTFPVVYCTAHSASLNSDTHDTWHMTHMLR